MAQFIVDDFKSHREGKKTLSQDGWSYGWAHGRHLKPGGRKMGSSRQATFKKVKERTNIFPSEMHEREEWCESCRRWEAARGPQVLAIVPFRKEGPAESIKVGEMEDLVLENLD